MGSGVSSLGVDEEKLKYFLARRSDRRPVRNLCPVQEALTGGLDETAPARERKLEATSDLVHGDERNRESLDFLRLWLELLLDFLDLVLGLTAIAPLQLRFVMPILNFYSFDYKSEVVGVLGFWGYQNGIF